MPSSGFKATLASGVDTGAPVRIGALAGINPSSFVADLVTPMVQGIAAGKALMQPVADAVKGVIEYHLPENEAKRKAEIATANATAAVAPVKADVDLANFQTEKDLIPQNSQLKRLQTGNALKQEQYVGNQYDQLAGTSGAGKYSIGPSGKLEYSTEEIAKREQAIAAGKKTKEEAEADKVKLEKAKFDLQNEKEMSGPEKAKRLNDIEVEQKQNNYLLDQYNQLKNPTAATGALASNASMPSSGSNILKTEFPNPETANASPTAQQPAMFLNRFDPANRKIVQVENPAYKLWEKGQLNAQETEQAARKKAIESGMEGALNAPIAQVEKFLRGDRPPTPSEMEDTKEIINLIDKIKSGVGGWTMGAGGALGRMTPLAANDAKDFEAKVKKPHLETYAG
jgi:hypothetical protein